jgi:Ca2+/Na+ antiporter
MKAITNLFLPLGALLVLTGALFKIMHWENASVIMFSGFVSGVIGIISVYNSFKQKTLNKVGVILIMLGSTIVIVGALMKILHLQFADITIIIGMLLGLLGVGIIYYKYNKSREETKSEN